MKIHVCFEREERLYFVKCITMDTITVLGISREMYFYRYTGAGKYNRHGSEFPFISHLRLHKLEEFLVQRGLQTFDCKKHKFNVHL